jgi:hypothetical protein
MAMTLRARFALIATLALAACHAGATRRSVDLVITVDEDAHSATITCRGSSTGSCGVAFIGPKGDADILQAAVGEQVKANVVLPMDYCAGADAPDPHGCRAKPLVAGEQIVRMSETHD